MENRIVSSPPPGADEQNPLLTAWTTPFEAPPFGHIEARHFPPAFDAAMADHRANLDSIAADRAAAAFDNTIAALERGSGLLDRVSNAFYALAGARTDEAIMAVERAVAPLIAKHWSDMYLDARLYRRVDDLYRRRNTLDLTPEQQRVLERYHTEFRRRGAGLDADARRRLGEISERLAVLGTQFGQNVLADEQAYALPLASEDDLAGLPDFLRIAAKTTAVDRGLAASHAITLSRSHVEPFLQFSTRRDLRETVLKAWTRRGEGGGATDNRTIIAEMAALRAERARILGYPTYAHYKLDDAMARTPQAVLELLDQVWEPARRRVLRERQALQERAQADGANLALASWDWRYYAEKERKAAHDIDEAVIKSYLQLDRMIEAAFDTAHRLFGLTFTPVADVPTYHPDVRVWEVRAADGRHLGLFFGDYFARASKRSGAWMTVLRGQDKLDGDTRPLVLNVMNFAKSAEGTPALLSFDDARTLFHEFGHALHGLLSDVTYPMISGTNVLQDFVELPSQLYEHWLERPEVLRRFAVHYRTGEPMPEDLLRRLLAARTFHQGFATAEYVASTYADLDFHLLEEPGAVDATTMENALRSRIGMPDEIALRHRPPHFLHVFTGDGYAAGYYSYLWSEVLDADAFRAFEEAGDVFDAATARRLHDFIYSAGGSRDPAEAYVAFRGRLPTADALLKRRGLADAAPAGEA